MREYIVTQKEVWNQGTRVLASSPQEAIEFVKSGMGTNVDELLEYNYTLGTDTWNVEEVDLSKTEDI